MDKIPTIFERGDDFKVVDQWKPECFWVRDGEGIATEKLDGQNVMVEVTLHGECTLWKRFQPKGEEPRYVDTDRDDPADKHIFRALDNTPWYDWDPGQHTCEAIGPKIQSNPLNLEEPRLVRHDESFLVMPENYWERTYEGIRVFLSGVPKMEGIVFHHRDGRMAKIKARDFPR